MSGGLRHHNDEETGRAMRLDTQIIRSKITTLTGETSASALTEGCARNCKIKKQKFLDTTGVVRDVQ